MKEPKGAASAIALATADAGGFARSSPAKRKGILGDKRRHLSKVFLSLNQISFVNIKHELCKFKKDI